MQSKIGGKKNFSYYGFLKAIGEENIPSFNTRQESFVKYVSDMLPIVRPYEYLIIQCLVMKTGKASLKEVEQHVRINVPSFQSRAFHHALKYMLSSGFFEKRLDDSLWFKDLELNVELEDYMQDLLEYGLGRFDVEYGDQPSDTFKLWGKYTKGQVQQLLLNNPGDIMLGTKIYDGIVYIYVTIVKASSTKEELKYVDGYMDRNTFRWESVANVSDKELNALKNSKKVYVFVRKVDNEDGIQLPFTYIGTGKMEYIEGSKKANGAHLFRIPMDVEAPEDLFFDFKLPE